MTELAIPTATTLAVPPGLAQSDPTGGRLVAWAQAASAAHSLAKALVHTSFVPDTFKVRGPDGIDPGNATATILMGDELGLTPLAALRGIYIFKGTPALYARTMRALALSHGHEMWNEESSDERVIVCGRRRGSDKVERAVWTIARATKAGYVGSNAKYKSDPQAMLQAKADSEIARKIAADVLAGVPYSLEDLELEDMVQSNTTTMTRASQDGAPKRTARRASAPTPEPEEPPLDEEPAPPAAEGITAPQLKKLHAALGNVGLSDRDAALEFLSDQTGRTITTSKELTKAEASRVIDGLENPNEPALPMEDPDPPAWDEPVAPVQP
jgi:hypothetical protein